MAHELAVHRYDAELAHGTPGPFDPDMAVDGIDEFYDVLVPFSARRWERPLPAGSLHLHRTDGPGEWLVRAVDGAVVATHEHAKGDVAVRRQRLGPVPVRVEPGPRRRSRASSVTSAVADEWAALAP